MSLLTAMDSLAQSMNSRNTPLFAVRLLTSVTQLNIAQVILPNAQEMTLLQLELNAELLQALATCHPNAMASTAQPMTSKLMKLFAVMLLMVVILLNIVQELPQNVQEMSLPQ
jgi:hypothetical protein